MIRRIIEINRENATAAAPARRRAHEGAIAMVDGKAQLMRDDYCDGLGDCLPACPTGAITFVERTKRLPTTKPPFWPRRRRRKKSCPAAALAPRRGPFTGRNPLRRQDAPAVPAAPVAGADQACARERAMVRRGKASDRRRLYRLCLCQFPSGFHQGPHHAGRLPQAGRRGLFRQAHGDSEAQRHPQHHGRSDGSPLLRRY